MLFRFLLGNWWRFGFEPFIWLCPPTAHEFGGTSCTELCWWGSDGSGMFDVYKGVEGSSETSEVFASTPLCRLSITPPPPPGDKERFELHHSPSLRPDHHIRYNLDLAYEGFGGRHKRYDY